MAGSTTGVPQNRGLQLGEEQAPLLSPPDSRRPEMAYASYSLRLVNAGRRFFQIHSRRIEFKCLIYRLIADDIFLVNIGSGQTLGSARASRAGDGALAIADLRNLSARRRNQHGEARAVPRRRLRSATYSVRSASTGLTRVAR